MKIVKEVKENSAKKEDVLSQESAIEQLDKEIQEILAQYEFDNNDGQASFMKETFSIDIEPSRIKIISKYYKYLKKKITVCDICLSRLDKYFYILISCAKNFNNYASEEFFIEMKNSLDPSYLFGFMISSEKDGSKKNPIEIFKNIIRENLIDDSDERILEKLLKESPVNIIQIAIYKEERKNYIIGYKKLSKRKKLKERNK